MKNTLPLIVAVVMGVIAAVLIWGYLHKVKKEAQQEMAMETVLVAQKEIRAGESLSQKNLAARPYPREYVGRRAIRPEQAASVINSRARHNLEFGRPIFWTDLELPSEMASGLAGMLGKGTRAVTFPVTEISGVAGFLKPGDRVDILYTFNLSLLEKQKKSGDDQDFALSNPDDIRAFVMRDFMKERQAGGEATVVLLQNVLLLAVGSNLAGEEGGSRGGTYASVTVRVDEKEAQMLVFCQDQGKLSLLLRNPKYPETEKRPSVVTAGSLAGFLEGGLQPSTGQ